jgi:hypothetical protein
LLSTGVLVVGLLQAKRKRKRGFQVPGGMAEDIVGELESECVMCRVLFRLVSCPVFFPAAGEFVFLLQAKERANHMHAALFSYVGRRGVSCRRVGGRPDGPCRDPAIMAYLVPEQW